MANGSKDTSACICAHDVISSCVVLSGGARGSAASKKGQERSGRSDGSTDVEGNPAFTNIDGEGAGAGGSVCGVVHVKIRV